MGTWDRGWLRCAREPLARECAEEGGLRGMGIIAHTEITCVFCEKKILVSWEEFAAYRKHVASGASVASGAPVALEGVPLYHPQCLNLYGGAVAKRKFV